MHINPNVSFLSTFRRRQRLVSLMFAELSNATTLNVLLSHLSAIGVALPLLDMLYGACTIN
jgi:hypothetical protein